MLRHGLVMLVVATLGGCGTGDDALPDVTGPFTGTPQRFRVTAITLPANGSAASAMADDLDGNGTSDNQLGNACTLLAFSNDLAIHGDDMIAAGVIRSTVEIVADDPANDDTVSLAFFGTDTAASVAVGGRITDGTFVSNRSRDTAVPGTATVLLPVFADADPVTLHVVGLEVDAIPRAGGTMIATIRGGVPIAEAQAASVAGIRQMIAASPARHDVFAQLVDANHDGTVTADEIIGTPLVRSLLAPDIQLFQGSDYDPTPAPIGETDPDLDSMSVAFRVTLTPCEGDACTPAAGSADDHCFDRVVDDGETDVDCGGECQPCTGGRSCSLGTDCDSGVCQDDGTCRAATCSDGVTDGFESDVDCGGGENCPACGAGKHCNDTYDCAGSCSNNVCI